MFSLVSYRRPAVLLLVHCRQSGSFSGEITATKGQIADLIIGIIYDEFTGASFESDTVYYEYDSINEEYFETVDTTKQEEKTYYVADSALKDVSEKLGN